MNRNEAKFWIIEAILCLTVILIFSFSSHDGALVCSFLGWFALTVANAAISFGGTETNHTGPK